jgi:hypothetical protein
MPAIRRAMRALSGCIQSYFVRYNFYPRLHTMTPEPPSNRAQGPDRADLAPGGQHWQRADVLPGHDHAEHQFARILTAIDFASNERGACGRDP